MKKVKCLEKVLLSHFNHKDKRETVEVVAKGPGMTPLLPCKVCKVSKHKCEVCQGAKGRSFYDYEITVGSSCLRCGMKAHNECLKKRHKCNIIRDGSDGIELLY